MTRQRRSERNHLRTGVISLVVVAVVMTVALNLDKVKALFWQSNYAVALAETSGLTVGNPVEISGVTVGTVTSIGFEGTHVRVEFSSSRAIGQQSQVAVGTATLLGSRFLDVTPGGGPSLKDGQEIPLAQSSTPYDITNALTDITDTGAAIDARRLAQAFKVLSQTFAHTPHDVHEVIAGTERLATAVAARDSDLRTLLTSAQGVSGVLARRSSDIVQILADSNQLLNALEAHRQELQALFTGLDAISRQVTGLVRDNQASLAPALASLHRTMTVVNKYMGNLRTSIVGVSQYLTSIMEGVGSGAFFSSYLAGISPVSLKPSLTQLLTGSGGN